MCPTKLGTDLGQTRTVSASENDGTKHMGTRRAGTRNSPMYSVNMPAYTGLLLDFDTLRLVAFRCLEAYQRMKPTMPLAVLRLH